MFRFNRVLLAILVLVFLLAIPGIASIAQEDTVTPDATATVEPTPVPPTEPAPPVVEAPLTRTEIIYIGILLIALAVVAVFGFVIYKAMDKLYYSAPVFGRGPLIDAAEGGFATLETIVEATPNTADDELARLLITALRKIIGDVQANPPAEPPKDAAAYIKEMRKNDQ